MKVPKNPKKVVVLDYGVLDTMDKLGLGDTVVGMPRENVPSYLKKYDTDKVENLGGLKEVDIEKINELAPDLIISSGRMSDMNEKFEKNCANNPNVCRYSGLFEVIQNKYN